MKRSASVKSGLSKTSGSKLNSRRGGGHSEAVDIVAAAIEGLGSQDLLISAAINSGRHSRNTLSSEGDGCTGLGITELIHTSVGNEAICSRNLRHALAGHLDQDTAVLRHIEGHAVVADIRGDLPVDAVGIDGNAHSVRSQVVSAILDNINRFLTGI